MRVVRITLSTVFAAAFGALGGAALFGLPSYFSNECGFMGCDRQWAAYLAFWGAIYGFVPGACAGLLVSSLKFRPLIGLFAGGAFGSALFLIFFATHGSDVTLNQESLLTSLAFIPLVAIIGWRHFRL
jgi:hypothetical protein